ncbi:SecDF P1 head subdomain-containing protein [Sinomicrobium sp. M5D2P9]
MTNNRMNTKEMRTLTIGLILITTSLVSFGQSRQEKTEAIIKKLNLFENKKTKYEFQIESLKYQATGNDSIKVVELEKKLTDDEIVKRISLAFNEVFNDEEIKDIYDFIQTSAFEKFFNSGETYQVIASQFNEIDEEIEGIIKNFSETIEKPMQKFKPIPVDKDDGFYATVDYTYSTEDKDIKLEDNPSLTPKDILEIKKEYNKYNDNKPEIIIVLKKDGARRLYLLTKENIGKPIAIVINNKIVSMPIIQSEIMGGKVSISGDFSEKEIDGMIERLKGE